MLVAILGLRWGRVWFVGVFAFVAILFNPLAPIKLSDGLWLFIDIGAAVLFLLAVAFVAPPGAVGHVVVKLKRHEIRVTPALAVGFIVTIALGALLAFSTFMLVKQLAMPTPSPTPVPTPTPRWTLEKESAAIKWGILSGAGGRAALDAFNKVWFLGAKLNPEEELVLRALFQQFPLGQTDFNVWLKQTVRQIHEQAAVEEAKQ